MSVPRVLGDLVRVVYIAAYDVSMCTTVACIVSQAD
jgi:hypothetical protein